jgi:hypothetical protein
MSKDDVVLNGQTTFDINVLPNESIYMSIYVNQLALRDYVYATSFFDNDFFT